MGSYWSSSEGLLLDKVSFGFGFKGFDILGRSLRRSHFQCFDVPFKFMSLCVGVPHECFFMIFDVVLEIRKCIDS